MKILYAEFETRHFNFRCVAVTKSNSIDGPAKRQIETTLRRGLRWHCKQAGVDPGKLLEYVGAGDYNIHLLEPGVLYQDC